MAAKAIGTSTRSVEQYGRFEREAPDLVPQCKADTRSLKRAERIVRDRHGAEHIGQHVIAYTKHRFIDVGPRRRLGSAPRG